MRFRTIAAVTALFAAAVTYTASRDGPEQQAAAAAATPIGCSYDTGGTPQTSQWLDAYCSDHDFAEWARAEALSLGWQWCTGLDPKPDGRWSFHCGWTASEGGKSPS